MCTYIETCIMHIYVYVELKLLFAIIKIYVCTCLCINNHDITVFSTIMTQNVWKNMCTPKIKQFNIRHDGSSISSKDRKISELSQPGIQSEFQASHTS